MRIIQAGPDYDFAAILRLIRVSFAYMEGRIDPPSSMHRLTVDDIAKSAAENEVWVMEGDDGTLLACVFLTPKPHALYVGKLTVGRAYRGKGYGRVMIDHAAERARAMGLPVLELQSRIELTENHTKFCAMGFTQTGATAHPGFDTPTSLTFTKKISP